MNNIKKGDNVVWISDNRRIDAFVLRVNKRTVRIAEAVKTSSGEWVRVDQTVGVQRIFPRTHENYVLDLLKAQV